MLNDFRQALRALRRAQAFSAVAVVTLALGIGANTALFSVADAVLLRPLPYPEPDRILWTDAAFFRFTKTGMRLRREVERSRVFEGAGIYAAGALNIGRDPRPQRVPAAAVTAGFFTALGAQPIAGRTFTEDEEAAAARVAVISHALWIRQAGSIAPGSELSINGRAFTVVGIMPRRVDFPGRVDVWIPVGADNQITGRAFAPRTIVRLASGLTPAHAAAEFERIDTEIDRRGSDRDRRAVQIVTLHEALAGHTRPLFVALAAAVGLVLLVACMNTASLLLARVSAREREMSVRRALGASRLRLVRHLLCESLLLAGCAGVLAVPAAMWTLDAVRALLPATLHGAHLVAIDGRAITVTAVLCLTATILFGIAPAWSLRRTDAGTVLRGTPASTTDPFWRRFRSTLVVAELAIALVLVAGAATIVRTVATLMDVDIGVRGERVLTMETTLPLSRYGSAGAVAGFHERLVTRLRETPGVERVGATNLMPGSDEVGIGLSFLFEGQEAPIPSSSYLSATPEYFRAIGIDLVAGRFFTSADGPRSAAVAIISDSLAARAGLSPVDAVGRRVRIGFDRRWASVVGVVRDVRLKGPEAQASAQLYIPFAQEYDGGTTFLVVKTAGDPMAVVPVVRAAVAEIDADLPLYNVRTFDQVRAGFVAERRFAMAVMSAFGLLAVLLAGIGLYGTLLYLVQLRTREIGIRMALGASPGAVRWQVVRGGLLYALAGAAAGSALSTGALRVMTHRVPGLQSADATLLAALAVTLVVAAAAITWFPARRATSIDPVDALRNEG